MAGAHRGTIAPLERFPGNPLVTPAQVRHVRASGTFNPGATVDRASGRVVLLVRVYDADARRSTLALALSSDGRTIDELWDRPAVGCEAPYEAWGVEDARVTWLVDEERYAITYTGYSPAGPRVCLITTDDLLAPGRYRRHGPRIAGDNKNCVVLPERVDGAYVILHRPMPCVECVRVRALEDEWPTHGTTLLGPRPGTWRSSRVGAGAPPIRTDVGWLLPFHGATSVTEGNVYAMGWCVLDLERPESVRYVSDAPALAPEAPYEIELGDIPQVDRSNFRDGVRVVFPQGLVERGDELLLYYGAADVSVAGARVGRRELVTSLRGAIARGEGGVPL
jgi:beta-1,2-mannobiose phosphorylase / 1,2-beta-oligomannan phosphorylase